LKQAVAYSLTYGEQAKNHLAACSHAWQQSQKTKYSIDTTHIGA
jgi:hypothetical protein